MASNALFAVTTDLPFLSAVKINSRAGSMPPKTSIIKSISGSATTDFKSEVSNSSLIPYFFDFGSRTATFTNSRVAPARVDKSDLFSINSRATCEPTTPQPSMPTFKVDLAELIGEVSQTYDSRRGTSITSKESKSA
ncbi:unannotated protein [freshwater metagenome]|uniref:Unannotated protein n=1 Tax=freshwater metagenome TaxID=449393 RepID=A0A6J6Y748_9ZZZZ